MIDTDTPFEYCCKYPFRMKFWFGLFTRMHLVERVASGIPRMREAMRKANLPEPEFHTGK